MKPADVDLETALRLLSLPRDIGRHPETGEPIVAGIGRFGAYLKHGSSFASLGADDDVLTIGLNRAVTLIAEAAARGPGRRGPQLIRELGEHPEGGTVGLYRGRYGPYVSHAGVYASLPKSADPETFAVEAALPLLAAQQAKGKGKSKRPVRKAASAKAAAAESKAKKPARSTMAKGKPAKKAKAAKRPGAKAAPGLSADG